MWLAKWSKHILIAILIFFVWYSIQNTEAQVPNQYKANHEFIQDYTTIVDELFVQIQANSAVWQTISPTIFSELNQKFTTVFPYLPQRYSFNVVYQQCLTLSQTLSGGFNYNTLVSFMENCFKPLTTIIQQINKDYSVIAQWSASPSSWPAPLTVTFDARSSTDPSNQTIPSDNFYRYYRDTNGNDVVIWQWPVLSYTFQEEWNYVVHLTVRSSNRVDQWILDGTQIFNVNVAPKSANIFVYANGQKMEQESKVKIGLQEWQRGVVFDGSPTQAQWGRTIIQHRRQIVWWNNNTFTFNKVDQGNPEVVRVALPDQWEYKVRLTTFDNQNNEITEEFSIVISDPVALIKQIPAEGNTSTLFTFDASTSYSITSRIRLYTREIFDVNWDRIQTFQWKQIKRQFTRPWAYTVKLTVEDDFWEQNIENLQVYVESSDPIPQFSITPYTELLLPSEFIFDAQATSDIDVTNGFDELSYERIFSNPEVVQVNSIEEWWKRIRAAFNQKWPHTVTLRVTDQYGKISEKEKSIQVESTLRPRVIINPRATIRGSPITFVVSPNEWKTIINHERDFGNGTTRRIQTNRIQQSFESAGVYKIKLTVRSSDGDENELTTQVFIGEKDSPIPAFKVINQNNSLILNQNDQCIATTDGEQKTYPAYKVDRYQKINIDTSDSVNTKWEKRDLTTYFQPKDWDTIRPTWMYSHDFSELWCQYIDIILEDTSINKNSIIRVWFKVVNALPTLTNITLSFPQFGNNFGVWLNEVAPIDIFNAEYDPLIIKVTAEWVMDPDGTISYFKRYYYDKNDPNRILGTKISPSWIPHAFFSLPKVPGEFAFGVEILDNDWWFARSENIIWLSPIIFFPPDANRPDIPQVVLKVNNANTEVGEEVTFDVVSSILSNRSDFIQERVIQYDFDWDGQRDITTKKDRVTHVYTQVNENGFTPRVSVLYRWYRWVAVGEKIFVKNALKPRLLYTSKWNLALFRDISIGDIIKTETCLDTNRCETNDSYLIDTWTNQFLFTYPDLWQYNIHMDVIDQNANVASRSRDISITENTENNPFDIISLPEINSINSGRKEIFVGRNLDNSILYYIKNNNPGTTCYIDWDIRNDTNEDGNPGNDRDNECNELIFKEYEPQYRNTVWRIFYEENWTLLSEDFVVSFVDYDIQLTAEQQEIIERINRIIQTLDPSVGDNQWLRNLLISLREEIIDKTQTSSIIVSIQDYKDTRNILLSTTEETLLDELIQSLKDKSSSAALWDNPYEQAKFEILSLLPHNTKNDVSNLFIEFESVQEWINSWTQERVNMQKEILNTILQTIGASIASDSNNIWDEEIDPNDMDLIIMPNICIIATYHNIATENCSTEDLRPIPGDTQVENTSSSWWLPSFIKILLLILLIVGWIFVILVIVFAVRAKLKQQEATQDEENKQDAQEEAERVKDNQEEVSEWETQESSDETNEQWESIDQQETEKQ